MAPLRATARIALAYSPKPAHSLPLPQVCPGVVPVTSELVHVSPYVQHDDDAQRLVIFFGSVTCTHLSLQHTSNVVVRFPQATAPKHEMPQSFNPAYAQACAFLLILWLYAGSCPISAIW